MVGKTLSNDFPVTSDAFQSNLSGNEDGFVLWLPSDIEPPISVAGKAILVDQHISVQFDGSNSTDNVGIVNWTWTFDYEDTYYRLYGPQPTFIFHEAGEVMVTLKVYDLAGNWASITVGVTVVDTTDPVAAAGDDLVVDQGVAFTLNGDASTDNVGIASWTWSFEYNGDNVSLGGMILEYAFGIVDKYVITLTVRDRVGNMGNDTITVVVRDTTDPVAVAGDDIEVEMGREVEFNGSSSNDNVGLASWTWTFVDQGNDKILEGEISTYTFELPGVYVVTLEVIDTSGFGDTDTLKVSVIDVTPPLADAGEDIEAGQGEEVIFDGAGSSDNVGITSWTWSFEYDGDEVIMEGGSPTYTFELPGQYIVTLTVEDAAGNLATDEVTVTVLDTEVPVAVVRGDATIEENTSLLLDGSNSTDNVGIASYVWMISGPDGDDEVRGMTVSRLFVAPGTYTVKLVVLDAAGNSAETSFAVVVTPVDDNNGNGNGGGDEANYLIHIIVAVVLVVVVIGVVQYLRKKG
jgi:PKD repeat protein